MSGTSWRIVNALGKDVEEISGVIGTQKQRRGHPPTSFPEESTVVLGAVEAADMASVPKTVGKWGLPLPTSDAKYFERGFLIVSCLRQFGGLHTKTAGTRATVSLNGVAVDGFGLRVIPEGHTDFFHRISNEGIPILLPYADCKTIYSWPISKSKMSSTSTQIVQLEVATLAWWDIDYVTLAYQVSRFKIFLCHGNEDKPAVRKLYNDLKAAGADPWLDEYDLRPGEDWDFAIRKAIKECNILLACLSNSSIQKAGFVQKEIKFALDRADEQPEGAIFIVPVRLEECTVPTRLSKWHWIDLFRPNGHEQLMSFVGGGNLASKNSSELRTSVSPDQPPPIDKRTIAKYGRFFRDLAAKDDILRPPADCIGCENLRMALRTLGYEAGFGSEFDSRLQDAVLRFQRDQRHQSQDGVCGAGTRNLLVQTLLERGTLQIFDRMVEP